MFDFLKRVVGELVMLLAVVNISYLLLSFLNGLGWHARVAAVSLLLGGVSVAMVRLK